MKLSMLGFLWAALAAGALGCNCDLVVAIEDGGAGGGGTAGGGGKGGGEGGGDGGGGGKGGGGGGVVTVCPQPILPCYTGAAGTAAGVFAHFDSPGWVVE